MSFLFNFDFSENDENVADNIDSSKIAESPISKNNSLNSEVTAWEVKDFFSEDVLQLLPMKTMNFGSTCLSVVNTSNLEQTILQQDQLKNLLANSEIMKAIKSNSDLVAGIYEGGLKVWECGIDLVEFLASHPLGKSVELNNKCVLELGCGAGLPGLYCCLCETQTVHFQDFNEEVIKLLTYNNVLTNTRDLDKGPKCSYFAGDWTAFAELAVSTGYRYDVILTAETIYSSENYHKLHNIFTTTLSKNGSILVAAKSYYFGVGGCIEGFLEYVGKQKSFCVEIVHEIKSCVPRQILSLKRNLDQIKEDGDLKSVMAGNYSTVGIDESVGCEVKIK